MLCAVNCSDEQYQDRRTVSESGFTKSPKRPILIGQSSAEALGNDRGDWCIILCMLERIPENVFGCEAVMRIHWKLVKRLTQAT